MEPKIPTKPSKKHVAFYIWLNLSPRVNFRSSNLKDPDRNSFIIIPAFASRWRWFILQQQRDTYWPLALWTNGTRGTRFVRPACQIWYHSFFSLCCFSSRQRNNVSVQGHDKKDRIRHTTLSWRGSTHAAVGGGDANRLSLMQRFTVSDPARVTSLYNKHICRFLQIHCTCLQWEEAACLCDFRASCLGWAPPTAQKDNYLRTASSCLISVKTLTR